MHSKNQSKWDVTRFFATLNYFGEIPVIGSFRWLQQFLGQNPSLPGITLNAMKKKILVLGADSAEWFALLQERLSASALLLLDAQQQSAQTEYEVEINSIPTRKPIGSISTKLANLIRTVDGLLIFNPSSYSDLVTYLVAYYQEASEVVGQSVFDFSDAERDLSVWGSLDDVVMGGVSQGSLVIKEQQVAFVGNVSTDNSGGFSSVRTKNFEPPFNFLGWQGLRLRVKGDGQRYKFILRNSGGWDSPAYIYGFDTVEHEWMEVYVPFAEMVPTFRAKSVANAPVFDPTRVFSFQLMLSKFEYDRRLNPKFSPGSFELVVSSIEVYRPRLGVPLVMVASQDEAKEIELMLRSHQSQSLNEETNKVPLSYRLIDKQGTDVVNEIAAALA